MLLLYESAILIKEYSSTLHLNFGGWQLQI
jgi:hypothetical protein